MSITRLAAVTLSAGMMALGSNTVSGQEYPTKPIRIFTGSAGGSVDFLSRLVADAIKGPLGEPVIVENRPTVPGITAMSKSPPDGYTIYLGSSSIWIGPLIQKTSYDAVKDLAPIAAVAKQSSVLIVHLSLPVKTVKDLIALAKARPGQLNYTSASPGSAPSIVALLFKSLAKADMQYVPEGSIQGDMLVMAGQVEMMFSSLGGVLGIIKGGKVRALGVASAERSQLAPELPTFAEGGLPGAEFQTTNAVVAPINIPPAVVRRLNQEITRAVNAQDLKQKMLTTGIEAASSTPEQLAAMIKADVATVNKMIQDGHIKTMN